MQMLDQPTEKKPVTASGALRIGLFMPSLAGGGAERVALNLARGLLNKNNRVDIVLGNARGPLAAELPIGARIVDLKQPRIRSTVLPLRRYLNAEQPDVLISFLDHANLAALLAHFLSNRKTGIVVTSHIHLSIALRRLDWIRRYVLTFMIRHFYWRADLVVAVSHSAAADLAQVAGLPPVGITVIYNPVITTENLAKALQPAGHPWLDENEYPVILAVGRLTEQKNHELLIRAFAQVIKQRKVRLVILGEGELRPRLQHLINIMGLADVVDMPGFVPNPLSYMNRAAVLAMSSSWEALPTSLIEALSLGVPVVSTNCPSGPAEILKDGQWGRLVQPDNPAAFARALLESLDSGRKTVPPESWQAYREEIAVQNYLDAIEKSGLCHRPQVVAKPLMS